MYNFKSYTNLLVELIKNFSKKIESRQKKMLLVIIPQKHDVLLFKKNKKFSYNFFSNFSKTNKNLFIIDLIKDFSNYNKLNKLYIDDKYAGHLSKVGNNFVSEKIFKYLKKEKITF